MVKILPSEAIELVRKNLEELDPNGSIMYDDENGSSSAYGDNMSMNDIIKRNLPEAINAVQNAAPVQLLEGKPFESTDLNSVTLQEDGVLSIYLKSSTNFLRLVAFRAADSEIVVTDILSEASPEGRKQLNPYIRGRYDRPRLVLQQGRHTGPLLKYYSLDPDGSEFDYFITHPSSAISRLVFVQEQFYPGPAAGYDISRRLRQNIIDYLTAMVMETYSDQRAQLFSQKANNFSII